jgi:uncharacterized iron-regulated membrane protein
MLRQINPLGSQFLRWWKRKNGRLVKQPGRGAQKGRWRYWQLHLSTWGVLVSLLGLGDFAVFGSFVVVLGLEDLDFSNMGPLT